MNFQQQLHALKFKTFRDNQTELLGYDDIFAGRRVIVFSTPSPLPSIHQLLDFDNNYKVLNELGIDQSYCISSDTFLVCPWAESLVKHVFGLGDIEQGFVRLVAEHYAINKPISDLSRLWQYAIIINNGEPEQLWHNPIKSNISWKIVKNPNFKFHGVKFESIKKYLLDKIN
jgi:peroxiredoxin